MYSHVHAFVRHSFPRLQQPEAPRGQLPRSAQDLRAAQVLGEEPALQGRPQRHLGLLPHVVRGLHLPGDSEDAVRGVYIQVRWLVG